MILNTNSSINGHDFINIFKFLKEIYFINYSSWKTVYIYIGIHFNFTLKRTMVDYPENAKSRVCPYDARHIIRTERFPCHLIRCERSNPSRASLFRAWKYDFARKIKKSEGRTLCRECEDNLSSVKAREESCKEGNTNLPKYKDVQIEGENWDKQYN